MPILRVDQNGKLYAASSDREDGGGFGYLPECVEQGDLTLGAAYLRAGQKRTNELLRAARNREVEALEDSRRARKQAESKAFAKRREENKNRILFSPEGQRAAFEKAIGMGCACDYESPMSGNVMTANGQRGVAGMSRDERTIFNVMSGRPSGAFGVDPIEQAQAESKSQVNRLLKMRARR